ncbi:MAG: patatin-like phospholipase family protein [Nevskia sp.]|nr:patatin-like phospholipase family protein [Nevskia sp.]
MEVRDTLAQCSLFASLPAAALERLAALCEPVHLRGGDLLFRVGTPSAYLYIVVLGRLRAQLADGTVAGEIARAEPIGEIGLLSGEAHGADVHALRDSLLLRIPGRELLEFVSAYPSALLEMARTIVHRLRRNQRVTALESARRVQSIALLPATPDVRVGPIAQALCQAMRSGGRTVENLDATAVNRVLGPGRAQTPIADTEANRALLAWLNQREHADQHLLYSAEAGDGPWAERCLRQSDRILFVADAHAAPRQSALLETLRTVELHAPVDLLLLRAPAQAVGDVAGWRQVVGADAHFFVRPDAEADFASLGRQLTGRAPGLVLSGGGARGFAHIGLIRALEELKIPVDVAGGTSMGAFISALLACGLDSREIQRVTRETFVTNNYLNDYVLPRVSLIRGRKFLTRLKAVFGERRIEALAKPYFCVSTNLTQASTMVHNEGELATWVGTSMAIPGMAPPVAWHGDLLVDGAVTNSLPTDVMQGLRRGPIIASDVSTEGGLRAPGIEGPDPEALLRRDGNRAQVSLIDILFGGIALTSESGVKLRASRADLYIRMPVAGIALFDWKRLDEIAQRGYEFATGRLGNFRHDFL